MRNLIDATHRWLPINIGQHNLPNQMQYQGPDLAVEDNEDADAVDDLRTILEGRYRFTWNCVYDFHVQTGDLARAAWLRSSKFDGSGKWLTPQISTFTPSHLLLYSDEYLMALRARLLLHPFIYNDLHTPEHTPAQCVCGHAIAIHEPFHFIDCHSARAQTLERHNWVRDILENHLKKSGGTVTRTPQLLTDTVPIYGDLLFTHPTLGTRVIDVTISDPSAPIYRAAPTNSHLVENATNTRRENEKRSKYNATIPNVVEAGRFVPFAVEATGRLGKAATLFLESVLNMNNNNHASSLSIKGIAAQIETAIAKGNAKCITFMMRKVATQQNHN